MSSIHAHIHIFVMVLGGYNLLLHSFVGPVGSKENIPMHGIYTLMGLEATITNIIWHLNPSGGMNENRV